LKKNYIWRYSNKEVEYHGSRINRRNTLAIFSTPVITGIFSCQFGALENCSLSIPVLEFHVGTIYCVTIVCAVDKQAYARERKHAYRVSQDERSIGNILSVHSIGHSEQ
jgi:hypothetical protein